jgi:predicted short-subunit dehydrogenase-like oxidoreductase (DUF2520 family)
LSAPRLAIIGPGRLGQGLALALRRRGFGVTLWGRRSREVPPPLSLTAGPIGDAVAGAEIVLLAVPDAAVTSVATELAESRAIDRRHVVLHLSGLLDRSALAPLEGTGAALGSFHPLQTIADAATAAERLRGAYAAVEGDPEAIAAAERLASTLRLTPVRLDAKAKAAYHAGATIVANYTVALVGLAARIAEQAGVAPELASRIYLPLLNGAAANLATMTPAAALTGAVARGDAATIDAHLAALAPGDRALYRELGLAALALARDAGLDEAAARRVERALGPVSARARAAG